MKKIKYIAEFISAMLILPFLIVMPYRMRIRICAVLGILVYKFYKKRRIIALANIVKSFPDLNQSQHDSVCRESFRHFGISIAEFIQLIRFNDKFISKYISVEGENYLSEALERGRGLISICPHLGNWEFIAAYAGLKGYSLSVVMKRQSNPYINKLIEKLRLSFNMELIYKSKAGFPVLRALKQNKIVALVADQDAGRNGLFVDFLGRPASTAQGPARLALAGSSPVIVCSGIRSEKGKLKIIFSPFLNFKKGNRNDQGIVYENTVIWTKKIEEFIKKNPEQYFWMHRRWKTQMPPINN